MTSRSTNLVIALLIALLFGAIGPNHAARSQPFAKNFTVESASGPYNLNEPGDTLPARERG